MMQIFKNLMRYKTATILNLIGLSTAFAAFIIIGMQVRYDFTYEKEHENYASIYTPSILDPETGDIHNYWNNTSIDYFKIKFPEIENFTLINHAFFDSYFTMTDDTGVKIKDNTSLMYIDKTAIDIFSFEFIEGDPNALSSPTNIIISSSYAKKYFGDKSPIGYKLNYSTKNTYVIAAVFKTLPENSVFQGDMFIDMDNYLKRNDWSFRIYFQLKKGADLTAFNKKVNADSSFVATTSWNGEPKIYKSVGLTDVRSTLHQYDSRTPFIMGTIALLLIVLAFINFLNFAISMVPLKIKGINIRKIVGATSSKLRMSVIGETILIVIISFVLAIIFIQLFKDSSMSYIINDIEFKSNVSVYVVAISLALFMAIVSGLYPAFYSTSFQPALILKSSYALSIRGVMLRKSLIGFQFFVAISFIAISIFVKQQHSLMIQSQNIGYQTDNIITINHSRDFKSHDELKNELLNNAQIQDVTFSLNVLGTGTQAMKWGRNYSKGKIMIRSEPVADNFLEFFDIEILSGVNFNPSHNESEDGTFIFSKLAMDRYELTPLEKIKGHTDNIADIIGVCDNVRVHNSKIALEPFAFYLFGKNPWYPLHVAYVKITGDTKKAINIIRETYAKINPDNEVDIQIFNDTLAKQYPEEEMAKNVLQYFSLLAIIIALVGVFGLVSFDTRFRRKEIGLRKVHGATIGEILRMFSTNYVKIVFISFALSVPVVYYLASEWLQQFPYRIELSWWVFVVALLMVLGLTITISFIQTYRSASENPIKSIKTE